MNNVQHERSNFSINRKLKIRAVTSERTDDASANGFYIALSFDS